jgi:hypothetical protein
MHDDILKSLPAIDQIANEGSLMMLKAVIPYLPPAGQQILAFYAKGTEMANLLRFYQSAPDLSAAAMPSASPSEMLQDVRCFCHGEMQEQIDSCIQMMQMLQLYQTMFDGCQTTPEDPSFDDPERIHDE